MATEVLVATMKQNTHRVKWALFIGSALAIAYLFGEVIYHAITSLAQLAVAAVGLLLFFYLWPALCEFAANLGMMAYESAVRGNPCARLKRDLAASSKNIDERESSISNADASIDKVKRVVNAQRKVLSPEDLAVYDAQIEDLETAREKMIEERDSAIKAHEAFKLAVDRYEAKYSIAGAFKQSLPNFRFHQTVGAKSEGAKIAFDEIDRQLEKSHSALKIAMSRPKTLLP